MHWPLRAEAKALQHGWSWLTSTGVDFIALGAAVGLIAAIALGAPHLQLY